MENNTHSAISSLQGRNTPGTRNVVSILVVNLLLSLLLVLGLIIIG